MAGAQGERNKQGDFRFKASARSFPSHFSQGLQQQDADVPTAKTENDRHGGAVYDPFADIFGKKPDPDRLLIAALLLILVKEGADMKLILALGYILM